MDSCCAQGTQHTGTVQGSETKLGGRDTYMAKSPEYQGKALLFLHDAFGWKLLNNRFLVDYFAHELKALVVCPDFFDGDAVPENAMSLPPGQFDIQGWFQRHNNKEAGYKEFVKAVEALKSEHGATSIGVIGYCWGGWGTFLLAHTDLVKTAAVAHPSSTELPHYIQLLKQPTLFLCAEIDRAFPQDGARKEAEEILKSQGSIEYKFVDYPGMTHGFAAKGDLNDPAVKKAFDDAREQAANWFNHYL